MKQTEYPIIKFAEMNSGDLIADSSGQRLVVYKNQDLIFLDKQGGKKYPRPNEEYFLIQKRRYVRPLNKVWVGDSTYFSYYHSKAWFKAYAQLGAEPAYHENGLVLPDCSKPEASFRTYKEAILYKQNADEPQLLHLYKDKEEMWSLTKSYIYAGKDVEDETLKLKEEKEEFQAQADFFKLQHKKLLLDNEDLHHEVTRLRGLDDENEELFRKNTELEGTIRITKARIEELEKEKAIFSKNIGGLVDEVVSLRLALKDARIRIEDNQRDYSQTLGNRENKIEDLEIDLDASKKELELLKAEKEEIEKAYASKINAILDQLNSF